MKYSVIQSISKTVSVLLVLAIVTLGFSVNVYAEDAENNSDPVVVVSLGDSYSSGEGIEPFYGQDEEIEVKIEDEDWLAHRSTKSWPSLLKFSDSLKTMGNYKYDLNNKTLPNEENCQWYFIASSGAKTENLRKTRMSGDETENGLQKKEVNLKVHTGKTYKNIYYLPNQLDIFNNIDSTVDYVTLTIGGNDVDFSGIITNCVVESSYLSHACVDFFNDRTPNTPDLDVSSVLEWKFINLWDNINDIRDKIKQTYIDIHDVAPEATIIVAGYPKLLDKNGKGKAISKDEATLVNENVTAFNDLLNGLVIECQNEGINIVFVSVESEFDKDGGHQAYSDDEWINPIIWGTKSQDLNRIGVTSMYSIHPNEEGAKAYARCVNTKIESILKNGKLTGKICKASDRNTPISGAAISVYQGNVLKKTVTSNSTGDYSIELDEGDYRLEIAAGGYISFSDYTTVAAGTNTYMETFLMVQGKEGETSTAVGCIKNALSGEGVSGVTLSVRKGWNNTKHGDAVHSTTTNNNGNYSVTLPLGNYTLCASKNGYISSTVNIVIQPGITASQDGTMSPIITGNDFRIVLTWGENPRDLDSHVVGELSSGGGFHVYYGKKTAYDGVTEICNLDVDDTSSYGPETITLTAANDAPYYYYVHHFSGIGTLASSEAQINVYQGESKIATFNVPTDQGGGRYWNVFAIKDGNLVINNTITSQPNINYANYEQIIL